jgi:hypothetical protein
MGKGTRRSGWWRRVLRTEPEVRFLELEIPLRFSPFSGG